MRKLEKQMPTKWLKVVLGTILAATALNAVAQDFPMLKGNPQRTGENGAAATSGPGIAGLNWWFPSSLDFGALNYDVDNLDGTLTTPTGAWNQPSTVGEWAENVYNPNRFVATNPTVSAYYRYAFATASVSAAQPTVPQNGANLRTWTWQFPTAGLGAMTPGNYALYVWLPIGPTFVGGQPIFPQRYNAYEITYGDGRTEVEVVDTFAGGTGWVRLGNGGFASNRVYYYDGTTPIRIRLFNTTVRRADGSLTENVFEGVSPIVYADAVLAVRQIGSYRASPVMGRVGTAPNDDRVVTALNSIELDTTTTVPTQIVRGIVRSFNHDGLPVGNAARWTFSPVEVGELAVLQDNTTAGVLAGPGWVTQNTPTGFRGTNFLSAPVTDDPLLAQQVTYTPNLDTGSYEIWAWIQGSGGGLDLSRSVTYEILEGATVTTVTVDQDAARGWVRLGTRRFANDPINNQLRVRVVNECPTSELGRFVYADTIRYIGANDTSIDSTPIQTRAIVNVPSAGGLQERPVVVVAAENGRLYCLDAVGNGDGTTNLYWTYPSTPDQTDPSWTDPNWVASEDGSGGQAIMPTGFNLSSALIERVNGEDFLYIQATNGRVYCIEMAGRGDMNLATGVPGSTRRRWTWPDDFPSTPAQAIGGATYGSVAFANTSQGPTLFVPSPQGRIIALDADGTGNKRTTVRWAFPDFDEPNFPPVEMTPALGNETVFVGFPARLGERGQFFALDWDNGNVRWSTSGSNLFPASDYRSGPVLIPSSEFAAQPDTVVVANDNGWIQAFNQITGALLWETNELAAPVLGNLTYSVLSVPNTLGASVAEPLVLVPTNDGRFMGLYAEATSTNIFGGNNRLAWGFNTFSDTMETSLAVGRNYMYGTDTNGILYAFNNSSSNIFPPGTTPPGQPVVPPNDPVTIPFRNAKIRFITREMYDRLRLLENDTNFPEYSEALAAIETRTAFEWGETIYVMAYDFPDVASGGTQRTTAEFRFASEGVSIRNLTIRSKQFAVNGANNPPTDPTTGELLDGVAIISYVLQGTGANAMPPGPGTITFSLSADFGGNGLRNVPLNPATARRNFNIANPLALAVAFNNAGQPLPNFQVGVSADGSLPENLVNGSPDIASTTRLENRLLANAGSVQHNQLGTRDFAVYDRSLMTLLRGPGRGLDLVRVVRSDLNWQGGLNPISSAGYQIPSSIYPNFEDLPINFPNLSLDYPDIRREQIAITKERFGNSENPVNNAISLNGPDLTSVDPVNRIIEPTQFTLEVNVPRFQPFNQTNVTNSANAAEAAGYYGQLIVYVDGSANGQFETRGRREAFRSMWLGASVPVDEKIVVGRSELDLGSQAQGTGFSPIAPWQGGSPYSPWSGQYQSLFKTFRVFNEGNANLLNVRLAKGTDTGGGVSSWGLFAPANNDAGWIDTLFNLWSDIDSRFALNVGPGYNRVLLQKPRVGDRNGTELFTNPIRRSNPNLGVGTGALLANPVPAAPRLSVTIPIGTPVGTYLTDLRVINDVDNNDSLRTNSTGDALEPISEPALTLKLNVREARITNGFTQNTSPMVHGGLLGTEPFLHQNLQPTGMRDLAGNLIVGFASDNSVGFNDPQPLAAKPNDAWRLYFTTIGGTTPTGAGFGQNPLRDLMSFGPQPGRWFRQAVGPFPTQAPADPVLFGPDVLPATAKFTSPTFAQLGGINPFTGAASAPYVAFVGDAQVQTSAGRSLVSKIFLSRLTIDGSGTISNISDPVSLNDNLNLAKGKPALVQAGDDALVIFTATAGSQSRLMWSHVENGVFSPSTPLSVGSGFESIGSVTAHGRVYQGVNQANGLQTGNNLIEFAFTAKLKGRPNREVFLGRMRANGSARPINVAGSRSPIVRFAPLAQERLVADGEPGTFRATGIDWVVNGGNPVRLEQSLNGTVVNLEVPNTRVVDELTGLITFDTRLGGKAYLDPALGTVRFSGVAPSQRSVLLLTYTPRFLRISTVNTANYGSPTLMVDQRFISEYDYWANANLTGITSGAQVRPERFVLTYGRTAAGTGQTARPHMRTLRLGIQLFDPVSRRPLALHTQPNGNVTDLVITGQTGPIQVDPANGRIYVTAQDEGRTLRIVRFAGIEEGTGNALTFNVNEDVQAQLINERSEAPILIEQAVNETQLSAFIDPFDNPAASGRRPGLIWMFWTSTRAGGPDVYMQTIAPKLTPRPRSSGN